MAFWRTQALHFLSKRVKCGKIQHSFGVDILASICSCNNYCNTCNTSLLWIVWLSTYKNLFVHTVISCKYVITILCYAMKYLCYAMLWNVYAMLDDVWWYAMLCYGMLWDLNKIVVVHRRVSNISKKNGKRKKIITHLQCEHLFSKI